MVHRTIATVFLLSLLSEVTVAGHGHAYTEQDTRNLRVLGFLRQASLKRGHEKHNRVHEDSTVKHKVALFESHALWNWKKLG